MATSSERSPPPFPDSEDQDVLDSEVVGGRDSDEDDGEDLFMSAVCLTEVNVDLGRAKPPLLRLTDTNCQRTD